MFKITVALASVLAVAFGNAATTCQDLCDATDACHNDPHEHGSYCKTNNVCFGLYTQASGDLCFQPNDETCDDQNLPPVICKYK